MRSELSMGPGELAELARVEKLLEKHGLEVDNETEQIIAHIVKGNVVNGVAKLLTKDWAINKLVQLYGDPSVSPSIRQRSFEFLCDLLGHTPQGRSSPTIMDVTIGKD